MSEMETILLDEIRKLRMDFQNTTHALNAVRNELKQLKPENEKFVSVGFVAKKIDTTPRTVRSWCELGKIKARQPGGDKGRWKIPYSEMQRLIAESESNNFNQPK